MQIGQRPEVEVVQRQPQRLGHGGEHGVGVGGCLGGGHRVVRPVVAFALDGEVVLLPVDGRSGIGPPRLCAPEVRCRLVEEVDGVLHGLLGLARKPDQNRGERDDAAFLEALDSDPVLIVLRQFAHGLQNRGITRLDSEENARAAAFGGQVEGLVVAGVGGAEVGVPVQPQILFDDHPADLFEAFRGHVEGVVDEDDVAHTHPRQLAQFPAHGVDRGRRQGARAGRIVAETALEGAAARGARLCRDADQTRVETAPVDRAGVQVVVLDPAPGEAPLPVAAEHEIVHLVQVGPGPHRTAETHQGVLPLRLLDVAVRAHGEQEVLRPLVDAVTAQVVDQWAPDHDMTARRVFADELHDRDDGEDVDVERRGHGDDCGALRQQVREPVLFRVEQRHRVGAQATAP